MTPRQQRSMLIRKLMFSISALEDLGRALSSEERFEVRLRSVLSGIMGSLPVARGGLFLYRAGEPLGGWLRLAALRGMDLGPGLSLPFPREVREAFPQTGAPLPCREAPPAVADYLRSYRIIFDGLEAAILQPLRYRNEFLGLVCLGPKYSGGEYGPEDLELLRIMGAYSAIGLHNQYLLTNLEEANDHLRQRAAENARLCTDLREMYRDTIRALGTAIDAKDPYTKGHSDRVARYSVAIARSMGLPEDEVGALNLASYLHDIGKLVVDNCILCKPRGLDAGEREIINRHPLISYEILSNIRFPYRDVPLLARHHHERLNGSGYPDGKKGEDLTTAMKVLSLADAFDAMTSDRPYRPALTVETALAEIVRCVRDQFDREATGAFLGILRREAEGGIADDGILATLRHGGGELSPFLIRLESSLH
jgi:HD-GYP domain-containing protein (c-di-GMP phosphodiesterase class II)